MWYFMSLISMVLLLSPSCSDLLVISVLNLEQRRQDKAGLEHDFNSIPVPYQHHPSPDQLETQRLENDYRVPKITLGK
jgi:hypothetical protein